MQKWQLLEQLEYAMALPKTVLGKGVQGDPDCDGDNGALIERYEQDLIKVTEFGCFLLERYPELTQVCELCEFHIQDFVDSNFEWWDQRTAQGYLNCFTRLANALEEDFECELDLTLVVFKSRAAASTQNKRLLTVKDVEIPASQAAATVSDRGAKFVPIMLTTCGATLKELTLLKPEDIDLEGQRLYLDGRTVPLKDQYVPVWRELKRYFTSFGWETATDGHCPCYPSDLTGSVEDYPSLKRGSLPKNLSLHLRRIYAWERLNEELETKDLFLAWSTVQEELGYGPEADFRLFRKYIGLSAAEFQLKNPKFRTVSA